MNRHIPFFSISIFLVIFAGVFCAQAQKRRLPADITGADLVQLQEEYLKGINKGVDSLIPLYADALFYSGQLRRSLGMYHKAHTLDLPMNIKQKRNFSHAARYFNETSPFDEQTGYFEEMTDLRARIRPHCVNSSHEDFAPYIWNDLLFITSSRDHKKRKERAIYMFTRLPFLNVVAFSEKCDTVDLDFLPKGLNTRLHDGPVAIAADTSLLVITRNYRKKNKNGVQTLYLAYYTREQGQWSDEKSFPYNHNSYYVQHPFFDDENNTLYFSSDMPGGYGGFDLYKVEWDGKEWMTAENLGPFINSEYDEVFPSLTPGGSLVYTTNHIETAGGLDVVMVKEGKRYLLPFPMNTQNDDFSVTFLNEHSGYFATNRDYEAFGDNVYLFELFEPVDYPFVVQVLHANTSEPVVGAKVSYLSNEPGLDGGELTDENGEVEIYEGSEEPFTVVVKVEKDGFYPFETITDDFLFDGGRWVLTLKIDPVPAEPAIVEAIQSGYFVVYFDNNYPEPRSWRPTTQLTYEQTFHDYQNKRDLYYRNSSSSPAELNAFFDEASKGMQQLEWLAGFLLREFTFGRHMTIIFTSHASPLGTDEYNMQLSKRRFASVENFFRSWNQKALNGFIDQGKLDYENTPFGSLLAAPGVSADPRDLARSIYSVEAASERKVTISWRQDPERETGIARSIQDFRTARQQPRPADQPAEEQPAYHIIVASFSQLSSAERFAADLRSRYGTGSYVMPRTPEGFYRVSYASYPGREAAEAALPAVRRIVEGNPWILFQ